MDISFYDGCSNKNIKIKDDNLDLFFSLYDDDDSTWDTHLPLVKTIFQKMIQDIADQDEDKLKTLYRYFVESDFNEIDYKVPVNETKEVVITRFINKINQYNSESKFEILEIAENVIATICQFQGNKGKHFSKCEQCGDYNTGYKVKYSV